MNHIGSPKRSGREMEKNKRERKGERPIEENMVVENGERKKKKRSMTTKKPVSSSVQGRMRSSSTSTVFEICSLSPLSENALSKEGGERERGGGGERGGITPSQSVGGGVSGMAGGRRKVSLADDFHSIISMRGACPLQYASSKSKNRRDDSSSSLPSFVEIPGLEAAYWDIETGSSDAETRLTLIDNDRYSSYFQMYFYDKEAEIYVGYRPLDRFYVLCVGKGVGKREGGGSEFPRHALLICSKLEDPTATPTLWTMLPPSKKPTLKQIKESELGKILDDTRMIKVEEETFDDDFLEAETNLTCTSNKFMIVEIDKKGRVVVGEKEGGGGEGGEGEESFSFCGCSEEFEEFLGILGEYGERKGGGGEGKGNEGGFALDTPSFSIDLSYQSLPLSFTILPLIPSPSPLLRAKKLEQATVVIIFMPEEGNDGKEEGGEGEGEGRFDPSQMVFSEMNHVFVVVKKRGDGYWVNCVSRYGTHSNTPGLPNPPFFDKNDHFVEFLITKCINSQRSAAYSPFFIKKLSMKRKLILSDIVDKYSRKKNPKPQMKRSMSIKKHTALAFKKIDPDSISHDPSSLPPLSPSSSSSSSFSFSTSPSPSSPPSPLLPPQSPRSPPSPPCSPTSQRRGRKGETGSGVTPVIRRKMRVGGGGEGGGGGGGGGPGELEILNRQILEMESFANLLLKELGRPPLSENDKMERTKRAREKVYGGEGGKGEKREGKGG